MSLGQNIKRLRDQRNWTLEELSERSGVDVGTINALERRNSTRSMYAGQLAKAFGISLESLTEDPDSVSIGMAETLDFGFYDSKPATPPAVRERERHYPQTGEDGRIEVPLLLNAGSMGNGSELLSDDVFLGTLPLHPQWVANHLKPTSPMNLRFIHAYGDSMSPTFESGDILLVDTGQVDPRTIDGVYAMSANDRLYIKRVRQKLDGKLEVSSDNEKIKTVDELNGNNTVAVHGRVVWVWNGKRL